MSTPVKSKDGKPVPTTVLNAIKICDFINRLGMSPKQFMVTFLCSTEEEIVVRQRLSKIGLGGRETRSIVNNLGRLTKASNAGRIIWDKLILEEASDIVIEQEVTRSAFPAGGYVSSSAVTPDFFSDASDKRRTELVKSGMPFLHNLIHRKIAHAMGKKHVHTPISQGTDNPDPGEAPEEGADEDDVPMSMENLVYVKSTPKIQPALLAECNPDELGLPAFLDAMAAADRRPVNMSLFTPGVAESQHWRSVIKAQMASALMDYIEHIPGAPKAEKLPKLLTKPPSIDPIPMHKPNIHFLRMMDAPDSSAEGVSRVIDQILGQIGMDREDYAKHLLVAGGDVGSNQLVESLRVKRFPPIDSVEGYEWVLSVFGGAHTTWNMAKSLWKHHWGDSSKAEDTGVWRSAFALGLEYKQAADSQDFNTIMRSCQIVHQANLVFVLRSVSIQKPV
ncbi:uncharacterized protein MELLADRAFT_114352 [Melampsora larici-populina 98AG31]|uniref:DUF6589 domain-containing protein n=1 Tax=Melampsora larici-populina (strain 98AG31 / pathotype 3-4-7) TaxID=747676 RepID=F4SD55_MELLP|nr:uncharacterized protein MELLADRAFT_114352 [Melampsora larici-populina 98AG31]EGF97423.1 hypothetical protein MELLADRAFT_114352 [Melampsora larici-populina 98AG31]